MTFHEELEMKPAEVDISQPAPLEPQSFFTISGVSSTKIASYCADSCESEPDPPLGDAPPGVYLPGSWVSGHFNHYARRVQRNPSVTNIFSSAADGVNFATWATIFVDFVINNPQMESRVPDGPGFLAEGALREWTKTVGQKAKNGLLAEENQKALASRGLVVDEEQNIITFSPSTRHLLNNLPDSQIGPQPTCRQDYIIPELWLDPTSEWGERAFLADACPATFPFSVSCDSDLTFQRWCQIFSQFDACNRKSSARALFIPGTGFGFLNQGRLYKWVEEQKRKYARREITPDQEVALKTANFWCRNTDTTQAIPRTPSTTQSLSELASCPRFTEQEMPRFQPNMPMWIVTSPVGQHVYFLHSGIAYQIPNVWTESELGQVALYFEQTGDTCGAIGGDEERAPVKFSEDANVDWLLWFEVTRQFAVLNPPIRHDPSSIPQSGPGFLSHGQMFHWARCTEYFFLTGQLPANHRRIYHHWRYYVIE